MNLVVDEQKVVSYQMTKAFSKLEKAQSVLNGREKRSLLELFNYIVEQPEAAQKLLKEIKNEGIRKPKLIQKIIF